MWHLSDGGDLLSTLFSPIAPINPYIIHNSLTRLLTFFPFFLFFSLHFFLQALTAMRQLHSEGVEIQATGLVEQFEAAESWLAPMRP